MSEWISVLDSLPSEDKQVEVVFYSNPYEWWAGMFTPKGFIKNHDENVFEYHQHWGDDRYHKVDGVTHWLPLPRPKL